MVYELLMKFKRMPTLLYSYSYFYALKFDFFLSKLRAHWTSYNYNLNSMFNFALPRYVPTLIGMVCRTLS